MRHKEDYNKYYKIEEELGRGGFGVIYNALNRQNNQEKALKIMEKNSVIEYLKSQGIIKPTKKDIDKYFNSFIKEAKNMEILQGENKENKNAVFIEEFFHTENEFVIVMEKCDNNLFKHLASKKEPFNSDEIYEILKQLNNSFEIMVKNKILHRALKPQNILLKYLNKEKSKFLVKLKITDDSCSFNDSSNLMTSSIDKNNLKITSPEILKGEKDIKKSDLWSIGILIYLLYFKVFPFKGANKTELLNNINSVIEEGKLKKINDHFLDELMIKLLAIDPKKRIDWEEYFNHSFFLDNPKNNYENFYIKGEKIGEGGFGSVYKATKIDTGEERALKIISKTAFNTSVYNISEQSYTSFLRNIKNEVNNMSIAEGINKDNQNTVGLYEYFDMRNEFVIIMELCDTSLGHILNEKIIKKKKFEINEILEILLQLNKTFKIMVKNRVAHRDLKLDNILLKKNEKGQNIWKLIDYGVSKQLPNLSLEYTTFVGCICYIAPEILEEKPYTNKCDLWSLGIIIYCLCFLEPPYNGKTFFALKNQIKNSGKKVLKKIGNNDLDDLINKLLESDPNNRISWEEYFNHPFFKNNKI